jgi:hypothetical protein
MGHAEKRFSFWLFRCLIARRDGTRRIAIGNVWSANRKLNQPCQLARDRLCGYPVCLRGGGSYSFE